MYHDRSAARRIFEGVKNRRFVHRSRTLARNGVSANQLTCGFIRVDRRGRPSSARVATTSARGVPVFVDVRQLRPRVPAVPRRGLRRGGARARLVHARLARDFGDPQILLRRLDVGRVARARRCASARARRAGGVSREEGRVHGGDGGDH